MNTNLHNYELEKRLADRLRSAAHGERRALYAEVYDEYFRNAIDVPFTIDAPRETARQVRLVTSFLPFGGRYLEIGAGTCHVASEVSKCAGACYAVEVSDVVVSPDSAVTILSSDGVLIPVADGCIDLVYSNQLMEHLHPDDAGPQLRDVRRVLAQGGKYLCITPNRYDGPHDVSRHFSAVAEGFHLREYSIAELSDLLVECGFRKVGVGVFLGGEVVVVAPTRLFVILEALVARLPRRVRLLRPVRKILNPGGLIGYA